MGVEYRSSNLLLTKGKGRFNNTAKSEDDRNKNMCLGLSIK